MPAGFTAEELEKMTDDEIYDLVLDMHYDKSEGEANEGDRDPDDVWEDADIDASHKCNEGREACTEWLLSLD